MSKRHRGWERVWVVGVVLGLWVVGTAAPLAAQDWQNLSQSRKFGNERALKVDVEYAAGRMTIGPAADGQLYRADLRYDANIFKRPQITYGNGLLAVDLSDGHMKGGDMKAGKLDLLLGTRALLDLDLTFGAAEAQIDLGGLQVRNAKIQTGASQTQLRVSRLNRAVCSMLTLEVGAAKLEATGLGNLNVDKVRVSGGVGEVILDFSGASKRDTNVQVEMGLGSLILRVPRGTGLMVTKQGLLASFDSEGMIKRGDSFYSENWKSAERQITVGIEAAFGSIKVEWLEK